MFSFFDAGATDGLGDSASWLFQNLLNWHGVLVEPTPILGRCVLPRTRGQTWNVNVYNNAFCYTKDGTLDVDMLWWRSQWKLYGTAKINNITELSTCDTAISSVTESGNTLWRKGKAQCILLEDILWTEFSNSGLADKSTDKSTKKDRNQFDYFNLDVDNEWLNFRLLIALNETDRLPEVITIECRTRLCLALLRRLGYNTLPIRRYNKRHLCRLQHIL